MKFQKFPKNDQTKPIVHVCNVQYGLRILFQLIRIFSLSLSLSIRARAYRISELGEQKT